jgi:hypothetical protein
MTRYPLVRQILGAVAGSTVAALLYVGYTGASHAVGGDLASVATAALLGGTGSGRQVARVVEPPSEPAPLPELGMPLRERAVPTPPPPQPERITPEPIIDAAPAEADAALAAAVSSSSIAAPEPAPVVAAATHAAAPVAATAKADALPSSGAADWLVVAVSAGAALGWQHRRLAALLARARVAA